MRCIIFFPETLQLITSRVIGKGMFSFAAVTVGQ